LTRALYGTDLPKQFAVLDGERSLLQHTIERAAVIGDRERILVVVSASRAALAAEQIAPYPGVRLMVQPVSRDTGPGLIFPLAYVRARNPQARVVVLPADHHVPNPRPLYEALERAAAHRESRRRVTLVGVQADRPETEYGWVLPGARLVGRDAHAVWTVRRFVEKPAERVAHRLRTRGAVWNTFIAAGPVSAFWDLARARLPEQVAAFEQWAARCDEPGNEERLALMYASLTPASWSHDVIAYIPGRRLALVAMAGTGWSDWGSPRRVFESLSGTAALERLVARVSGLHGLQA
jgi:mannose-1-phosphate guanylyltransferase